MGHFLDKASIEEDVEIEAEQIVAYDDVDVEWLNFAEDVGEQGTFAATQFDLELVLNVFEGSLEIVGKCT